ncbi:MAG: pyridoxamine 5'-phosphate oxidase family protein [Chloroflexota bacterium]|nr:pyridoxamine 5'-phosphate oxidase family protein [Anaerolineae bacterium]
MSLLKTHPDLLQALSQEMTPKFLATRSADGIPNVVPVTSLMLSGDVEDRLIFGNFLLRKSVGNLDQDPRVGILVITPDLEGWMLQGDFQGWQQTGAYADRLNSTDLLRYNAYTGIRNAGIIQVRAVLRHFRIPKLRVLGDYLLARAAARLCPTVSEVEGAITLPRPVRERFGQMMAVRVLAFLDGEGYPLTVPMLSLQPVGVGVKQVAPQMATSASSQRAQQAAPLLVCAEGLAADLLESLPDGAPVAASLLTFDVVSFQAKGKWLGSRRFLGAPVGAMAVTSVYAGGPPIPGRRVA